MSDAADSKRVVHIGALTRLVDPVVGDEIERLRKRVEELEEKAGFWELKAIGASMGHRISTDQINAAWQFVDRAARTLGWTHAHVYAMLNVLRELNIVRCEHNNEDDGHCRDCNAHGWVVKDE